MNMDNELDLAALRVFHAVVREGSFAGGARRLGVPRSTASKRVVDLERLLGVRLIERTTRQMRVTTEGEVLALRAERLLAEAGDIRRSLSDAGQAPRGHLRIAVPQLFGQIMMGGIAARCRARYPEITLEFVFTDRPPDLIEEGFDAMIRFGPLEDSTQVARRISTGAPVLAASPGLAGIETLAHPRDLIRFPLIDVPLHWRQGWTFHREDDVELIRIEPALRFSSMLAARDAAVEGAGITQLPAILARPEIKAGQLVRLLPEWQGAEKSMYFVFASPQSVTTRLRAFLDVLLESLKSRSEATSALEPS
ncbi:LysR family transcriptional regulator [Nitratireductor luteus]|uniref:LysR family transcriptional regulator n=1 Tax=Nitratireductor luteus TaxID=2976980 RepID=UPI00223F9FFB|nr:LysR family transcriptional regulator [Nitratireductor luteus]